MNEQEIRNDERRKISEFIAAVATHLRSTQQGYDAGYLDGIIQKLSHPDWVKDTEGH